MAITGRSGLPLALGALLALGACGEKELILTGERLDLRADLDAPVQAEAEDRAAPIALPPQQQNASWTQRAGGADHALPHAALSARPVQVWSADIGEGDSRKHRITADPVVADGRIFTVDSRARVMAHSLSGQPLWSADLTPAGERSDDASGAGLAVANGTLYVSTGFGDLVALDAASGAERWVQELDAAASGAPTVLGDLVYVASRDARAWAVETGNGRVRWTLDGTPSPSGVVGGAAPAVNDRLAVFPFASGEMVAALREGGTRVWTSNVAGTRKGAVYALISDISGDPVISGGRVYAGSPTGRTIAVDLGSGEQLWSAPEGAMSPVLVAGGSVFTVTDRAELVRLDAATGARIWGTELPFFQRAAPKKRKAVYAHYGPILAGGRLWVASTDDVLRGFDPASGAEAVSVELPGGAATNPVVAGGVLYVVSAKGQLLAFR